MPRTRLCDSFATTERSGQQKSQHPRCRKSGAVWCCARISSGRDNWLRRFPLLTFRCSQHKYAEERERLPCTKFRFGSKVLAALDGDVYDALFSSPFARAIMYTFSRKLQIPGHCDVFCVSRPAGNCARHQTRLEFTAIRSRSIMPQRICSVCTRGSSFALVHRTVDTQR